MRRTLILALVAALSLTAACARRTAPSRTHRRRLQRQPALHRHQRNDVGTVDFPARGRLVAKAAAKRIHFPTDNSDIDSPSQACSPPRPSGCWQPDGPRSIEGHADERGTREYNLALGARRAD